MSPIAVGLDGLLALLLILALGLGMKLNARLKTLREGQAGFAAAVLELNQAAARAEAGLTALRTASESAHDELLTRIETARGLVGRLERAGADAQRLAETSPERIVAPARPLPPSGASSGSLAAIAALAEGRSIERSAAPTADPIEPKRSAPRRPARPAFDEDLFETKGQGPSISLSPGVGPRDRDLGPLRPHRGDR